MFLSEATATSDCLERYFRCYEKRRDMHATEYLRLSGGYCRQRGLSLSECLHAVHTVFQRSFEFRSWSRTTEAEGFRPIAGHDLVPWWWMDHWGRPLRILRAQVPAGFRPCTRHHEFPVTWLIILTIGIRFLDSSLSNLWSILFTALLN